MTHSVLDAAFHTVHDYPGGAMSLAPRLGKNPATLSHEVAAHGTAKFALVDAVKVTALTGDLRMLNAFAAQVGCMVLQLPDSATVGEDLMQQVGHAAKAFGEFLSEVTTDAADGSISINELRRIEKEWGDLLAVGQSLLANLRAMHTAGVRQ